MSRIGGMNQAIEEFQAIGPWTGEEAVLGGCQPDHRQETRKCVLGCRFAIDPGLAPGTSPGADTQAKTAIARIGLGKDRPFRRNPAIELSRHTVGARRAQTPTGREKGQRFKQIGLAGTILAIQGHGRGAEIKIEIAIAAKISQPQTTNRRRRNRRRHVSSRSFGVARHTRSGIST